MAKSAIVFVVVILALFAVMTVLRSFMRGEGFGLNQFKNLVPLLLGMLFLAGALLLMNSGSALVDSGMADKTPFEILKSFFS